MYFARIGVSAVGLKVFWLVAAFTVFSAVMFDESQILGIDALSTKLLQQLLEVQLSILMFHLDL